jgi:hypothetical protein
MGRLASFGPVELKDGAITASKLAAGALANQTIGLNDGAIAFAKVAQPAFNYQHFSDQIGPFIRHWAPSATVRTANDTEKSTTATTPTKRKEIKFNEWVQKIDVYFELKSSDGIHYAYARIYVNGNPVGTQRETNSSTYQGYDEEIGPLNQNDLLQIYVWQEAGGTGAYVRNMRLCYSYGITHFGWKRLANPMFFSEDAQVLINVTVQDPA